MELFGVLHFFINRSKKEGMGLGDAKLLSVFGFWFGLKAVPFVIFLSSAIALISVIPDLMKKSKTMSSQIPFGPYIILGALVYLIFEKKIDSLFYL